MGQITRTSGPEQGAWYDQPDTTVAQPTETAEARKARQVAAQERLGHAMNHMAMAQHEFSDDLATAMDGHEDDLEYGVLAETVAWLQDMRRDLATAEAYVARQLGRMIGCPDVIELPDGRRAEVLKGKDRKAWQHADWQRDVRNAIVDSREGWDLVAYRVSQMDGTSEDVDVSDLIAQAQAVHGSAAPKVTALKPLGLAADDYCESVPGPYSVRISAPATTTTEQEN
jgi:hypothetical protein